MKGFKYNLNNYYPTKPARKTNTSGLSLAGTGVTSGTGGGGGTTTAVQSDTPQQ